MSKLQEIENKLVAINDVVFQNLCDAYLYHTEPECQVFESTGSQVGKQKSRKGTPDSYYLNREGKYVLIEHTTLTPKSKSKLLNKIKEDIDKCLNLKITGIPIDKIAKIIYCLNSTLTIRETEEIRQYANAQNIIADLRPLGTLKMGLFTRAPHLAKAFLGIAIDSGQILSLPNFIKQYDKGKRNTGLSNIFVGRDSEKSELQETILSSEITLLTGSPGVGKTKLLVEVLKDLEANHSNLKVYVISDKLTSLYDDLQTYLATDDDFVICIDDANRQVINFRQIMSLLNDQRIGKLRIVCTVREYALPELLAHTVAFNCTQCRIDKLSDEQLTKILRSDTYNIKHQDYIDRILQIAQGNARLAIMAAEVALKEQNLKSLQNVSQLYESYFESSLDPEIFNNPLLMKITGIVAFFFSINREDTEFCSEMLIRFGISENEFEEGLVKLEKLEIIESTADFSRVRISEQILGTYFFYYVFFKKEMLSFETILNNYFSSHPHRIKDTVIPVNNTFDHREIYTKIEPMLNRFWPVLEANPKKAFIYFDLFWNYRQEEALHFVSKHIDTLPQIKAANFEMVEGESFTGANPFLTILKKFYPHPIGNLKDALELSAAFVNKNPDKYSELSKSLKETIIFDKDDEKSGFFRQSTLLSFLENEDKNDELKELLFYELAPLLLKGIYQGSYTAQGGKSIMIYKYRLPMTEEVSKIRNRIWRLYIKLKEKYPTYSIDFLKEYIRRTGDETETIYKEDLPNILKVLGSSLDKNKFAHCFIAQEIIYWFRKTKVDDPAFSDLENKFNSKKYRFYKKIAFDFIKGRHEYDGAIDHIEYPKLKEGEIRSAFRLTKPKEFATLYKIFCEIVDSRLLMNNSYRIQMSLDLILDEICDENTEQSLVCIQHIVNEGNSTGYCPTRILQRLRNNSGSYKKLFDITSATIFKARDWWMLNWFIYLPEERIAKRHLPQILSIFSEGTAIHYLQVSALEKFQRVSSDFFKSLLQKIYLVNKSKESRIDIHDFELLLPIFQDDNEFLKKNYLQQLCMRNGFDHDFNMFIKLLKNDSYILLDYCKHHLDNHSLDEHHHLNRVWELPGAEKILYQVMLYLFTHYDSWKLSDLMLYFYLDLIPENQERSIALSKKLVTRFKSAPDSLSIVFYCIRNTMPEKLSELVNFFLSIQKSFEVFSEISWSNNHFSSNGRGYTFGDMWASQTTQILEIIESIKEKKYLFSRHISQLKDIIAGAKKSSERERMRDFQIGE